MKACRHIRVRSLAVGLFSLAIASAAMAGQGPDPSGLPSCQSSGPVDACRLPLKNGQFDSLDGWLNTPSQPTLGQDENGNSYAALRYGATASQPVFANFGVPTQNAAYALRFRARADRGAGQIRATLSMSDGSGNHAVSLGETTTTVGTGEWNVVELLVNGAAFAAPAHVLLTIGNEGSEYVQVDDVHLVQAAGADAVSR